MTQKYVTARFILCLYLWFVTHDYTIPTLVYVDIDL